MSVEQVGQFLPDDLMEEIRSKIYCVDEDPYSGKRIYFENAGGALTLKACCELADIENRIPDAHQRPSAAAKHLHEMVEKGQEDTKIAFGAKSGTIQSNQTVSRCIANMVGAIVMSIPGTNVVTSDLEHPAVYDSARYFAEVTGKELRSAKINKETGTIDVDDLLKKVDKDTSLLAFMHASNITGALVDVKTIIEGAKEKKEDLYILLDSTQHFPHGIVDVEKLGIDACGFTPYKFLGKRGLGLGWMSDRASLLPHIRVYDKSIKSWEFGSCEPASWGSWTAVVDYLCWLGGKFSDKTDRRELYIAAMNVIALHERAIINLMLNGDTEIRGIKDISNAHMHYVNDLTERDCICPLTFDNVDTGTAVKMFLDEGITVFDRVNTNAMSKRVLDGCGLSALIRVSPMHYNTKEEVCRFLEVTAKIAAI